MIKLLKRYNLPYTLSEMDKSRIREYVLKDKKTRGDSINMILLKKIGEAYIHNIKRMRLIYGYRDFAKGT